MHFKTTFKAIIFVLTLFTISTFCLTPVSRASTDGEVPQSTATLNGTVSLGENGKPIQNALVTIVQLKRTVGTDENGKYAFQNIPPGRYDVVAHLDRVPDSVQSVEVTANGAATLDFRIELSGVREQVTVTATGSEQAVSSSIQSVEVIG